MEVMYYSSIDKSMISYLKIQFCLFSLRFPMKILNISPKSGTYQTHANTCSKTTKVVSIIIMRSRPTLIFMSSLKCLLILLYTFMVFIKRANFESLISFWILPMRESRAILEMFPYSKIISKGRTVMRSIANQPLRYFMAISYRY